jgi:hypothetical protein
MGKRVTHHHTIVSALDEVMFAQGEKCDVLIHQEKGCAGYTVIATDVKPYRTEHAVEMRKVSGVRVGSIVEMEDEQGNRETREVEFVDREHDVIELVDYFQACASYRISTGAEYRGRHSTRILRVIPKEELKNKGKG